MKQKPHKFSCQPNNLFFALDCINFTISCFCFLSKKTTLHRFLISQYNLLTQIVELQSGFLRILINGVEHAEKV